MCNITRVWLTLQCPSFYVDSALWMTFRVRRRSIKCWLVLVYAIKSSLRKRVCSNIDDKTETLSRALVYMTWQYHRPHSLRCHSVNRFMSSMLDDVLREVRIILSINLVVAGSNNNDDEHTTYGCKDTFICLLCCLININDKHPGRPTRRRHRGKGTSRWEGHGNRQVTS